MAIAGTSSKDAGLTVPSATSLIEGSSGGVEELIEIHLEEKLWPSRKPNL